MKIITYSIFSSLLLLLLGCTSPAKLIEKGKFERAFRWSLKKIERGKIKAEYYESLEEAYRVLSERDERYYQARSQEGNPAVWPEIYEKCLEIVERQEKLRPVEAQLLSEGYPVYFRHLPAREWVKEARENSALYYYSRAQEYIPAARRHQRLSARQAYRYLEKCREYLPDFRNSSQLSEEMYKLGTTHILLQAELDPEWEDLHHRFFDLLFAKKSFPYRDKWDVFYLNAPPDQHLTYELELYFANINLGVEDVHASTCCNSTEVEDGFIMREVWSEKDSAYVKEKEIIYKTVSVTVTTYHQSKEANLRLHYHLKDAQTQEEIQYRNFYGNGCWTNDYSVVCGDTRALGGACTDAGGFCSSPPPEEQLLFDAVRNLRWRFKRHMRKESW